MSKKAAPDLSHIAEQLRPLALPVARLKHLPDNARLHDAAKDVAAIAASLTRFGQQKPLVALKDGTVFAGNGTLEAAMSLGWTHVAVNVTRFASIDEARAYALADNRTAELSRWDHQKLGELLTSLSDVSVSVTGLGWNDAELKMLMTADYEPPAPSDGGLASENGRAHSIPLTHDQYETVKQAIRKLREREGDGEISDGRCLELIAADFLAA